MYIVSESIATGMKRVAPCSYIFFSKCQNQKCIYPIKNPQNMIFLLAIQLHCWSMNYLKHISEPDCCTG